MRFKSFMRGDRPDPLPSPVFQSFVVYTPKLTQMEISKQVKSGVCMGVKWYQSEGTYYLKLPNIPETKNALDFLHRIGPPSAVYLHVRQSAPIAYQWRLNRKEHAAVWRAGAKEI